MQNIRDHFVNLRFYLLDLLGNTNIRTVLAETRVQQYLSKEVLNSISKEKLDYLFNIAKSSTKHYKNATSYAHLSVLAKSDIRGKMDDFLVKDYPYKLFLKSTSGSTGTPLIYYATSNGRSYLWAGIILSWEVAGYKLGDRVAFIAGSALLNLKSNIKHAFFYKLFNIDGYSAFSLNDYDIKEYLDKIVYRKTKIIYGYASAINKVATYINDHNFSYAFPNLKGIICTSEMLSQAMRDNINKAFKVDVFNQYGCNEAGVSAFECEAHQLHLISTRAFVENDAHGNLIATDLSNDGFPIIKYDTGDIVEVSNTITCTCKRNFPILKSLVGRSSDMIIDCDNKSVHCAFFQLLFRPENTITQYQISFDASNINIYINTDHSIQDLHYYDKYLKEIKKHLHFHYYNFFFNTPFLSANNAKHRHVVNLST